MRLKDRVAVITGGSSGIGEAIVRRFLEEGALVTSLDLSSNDSSEPNFTYRQADVSKKKSVEDAIAEVVKLHGKIDLLVNNAGIANIGTATTTSEEDFDRIYDVNIKGVYNCLHTVIPIMKLNKGGVIINLSSIAAHAGIQDRFAYSASKGAVQAMTYSVAKDYIDDNIRCNSISPARVHTPFVDGFLAANYPGNEEDMFRKLSATQPIGRMGTPEEIAGLVAYLCSDEAAFITGSDFPIDGGFLKLNT